MPNCVRASRKTYETFRGHISGSQTTRNLVVIEDHPRGAILQEGQSISVCRFPNFAVNVQSDSNASQHPNRLGLHQ